MYSSQRTHISSNKYDSSDTDGLDACYSILSGNSSSFLLLVSNRLILSISSVCGLVTFSSRYSNIQHKYIGAIGRIAPQCLAIFSMRSKIDPIISSASSPRSSFKLVLADFMCAEIRAYAPSYLRLFLDSTIRFFRYSCAIFINLITQSSGISSMLSSAMSWLTVDFRCAFCAVYCRSHSSYCADRSLCCNRSSRIALNRRGKSCEVELIEHWNSR